MKKLFTILTLVFFWNCNAQNEIKTEIKSVTVTLNGAQVFRNGTINYTKGVNKIIIDQVSPSIRNEGIQATSVGDYRVMDVKHQIKHPEPLKNQASILPLHIQKEINRLEDSIFYAQLTKENLSLKIETIKKQKDIINKNKLTTGVGKSDSLPILKDLVEYYQKKVFELDDQLMAFTMKFRKHNQNLDQMNNRLAELNKFSTNTNQPTSQPKIIHQIEVTVYAEKSGTGAIEVNYLVDHAGWYPAYDLRVDDIEKPLFFTYKAYVFQNTKEDWKNVPLKLVTYDNRINNSKPSLPIWSVDYMNELIYKQKREAYGYSADKKVASSFNFLMPVSPTEDGNKEMEVPLDEEAFFESQQHQVEIAKALSNFSFDIMDLYTIKSDGKEVLILVSEQQIEAEYKHYLVPKLDSKAYLMATVPNWESMNLLYGKTNLYFEKSYLGNTYLDPSILDDTLAIDLGVDQAVFCERKKIKDADKCRVIGNSRTQNITIEIVVKNNKNSSLAIEIEDQVPITTNEGIEITVNEKGKGDLNTETGKLTWDLTLKPQEKRVLQFTYTMKYDKNKKVI